MASKVLLNSGFALVTGAAAGIGKETAISFAEAGVDGVAFADINEEGAQEAAEASKKYASNPGYRAVVIKVDITDENSVQHMVDHAAKEFGRLDYAVNSAGLGNISGALTANLKLDVFAKTVDTNIKGAVFFVRAVTAVMATQEETTFTTSSRHGGATRSLGRGSIVLLGSVMSYIASPGMMNYTASKHAIIGITKSAATDSIRSHIRVNAVCPSWVDTPMHQASLKRVPELGYAVKGFSPLHRAATPDEVADYVLFLCSPSASYINGTGLVVDAGLTMGITGAGLIPERGPKASGGSL